MGEEKLFKTALNGFNRKDVIEYVAELFEELEKAKQELALRDEKIARLEAQLEAYDCAKSSAEPIALTEDDDIDEVLDKVDQILQNYLTED